MSRLAYLRNTSGIWVVNSERLDSEEVLAVREAGWERVLVGVYPLRVSYIYISRTILIDDLGHTEHGPRRLAITAEGRA